MLSPSAGTSVLRTPAPNAGVIFQGGDILSLEGLQMVLWWFLVGTSFVAIIFALNETRGIPLKALFAIGGPRNIPKKFYLFAGFFFIAIALLALISGNQIVAALLSLFTILQFRQYGLVASEGAHVTKI